LLQKNQEAVDSEIEGTLTKLDANAEQPKKRQRAAKGKPVKKGKKIK
jgi:hypothetical protein